MVPPNHIRFNILPSHTMQSSISLPVVSRVNTTISYSLSAHHESQSCLILGDIYLGCFHQAGVEILPNKEGGCYILTRVK
jgi:hypothetical protein